MLVHQDHKDYLSEKSAEYSAKFDTALNTAGTMLKSHRNYGLVTLLLVIVQIIMTICNVPDIYFWTICIYNYYRIYVCWKTKSKYEDFENETIKPLENEMWKLTLQQLHTAQVEADHILENMPWNKNE